MTNIVATTKGSSVSQVLNFVYQQFKILILKFNLMFLLGFERHWPDQS